MKPCQSQINQVSKNKRGKGERKQGTKWKDPRPRKQKNHLRGFLSEPLREHQVLEPSHVTRSISNKERGDLMKGRLLA